MEPAAPTAGTPVEVHRSFDESERDQRLRFWQKYWAPITCLLLLVATAYVYAPVRSHPFLYYDDQDYVIDNPHIKQGFNLESVQWAFTRYANGNWHPLTWLSHILDYKMFGLNPAGHHVVNLLLHLVNVALLFWVLWRATGYAGRSLMVAALFALHPINVESVAWVAERKNLLSMFFFLLALGAYRSYALQPRLGRFLKVAALYACGLMAKPQVITFPFVLLLWDYWPLERIALRASPFAFRRNRSGEISGEERIAKTEERNADWRSLLWEKVPLFALSMASAVVTVKAQQAAEAVAATALRLRLENAVVAYVRYLAKAFWPSHLAPMYVYPGNLKLLAAAASLALLVTVTTLVCVAGNRRRYLPVGWFWFLGTLVPMIGIVQVGVQAMADRYAYLPFIGLFIMLCWGVCDLLGAMIQKGKSDGPLARRPALVLTEALLGLAALLPLTILTHRQLARWKDNVTIWEYTLQVAPENYIAEGNLGVALEKEGRPIEAVPHFFRAVAIRPTDPTGNVELAMYYQRMGMLREAIAQHQKLLPLTPSPILRAEFLSNIGFDYGALGQYDLARKCFEQAVRDNPELSRAWMGLGAVTQRAGDLDQAVKDYRQSIQGHPTDVTYLLLARALEKSGRTAEAQNARAHAGLLSQNMQQTKRIADSLVGQ